MKKLSCILLVAAIMVSMLGISAAALTNANPTTAGIYDVSGSSGFTITPSSTSAVVSGAANTYVDDTQYTFYSEAVKFKLEYSNGSIAAGEQYLILVCSGGKTGAPTKDNIVYVDQATAVEDKVTFDTVYPSSLAKGDYRVFVVGKNSTYSADAPQATFSNYVPYTLGDVDGQDGIDTTDALLAIKIFVETYTPSETERLAADVDGKDGVDTTDALLIIKYFVEEWTTFEGHF